MDKKKLQKLQQELQEQVCIPNGTEGFFPEEQDKFLALDIQYQDDIAYISADLNRFSGEHLGCYVAKAHISMPYIPGYFCFREGPPLLALVEHLTAAGKKPDLLVLDGHGIAHPRCFGVACWLGITTQIPAIGCAKHPLIQYEGELAAPRGSYLEVTWQNRLVGHVLRFQDSIRPIYVSPGHLVSPRNAVEITLKLPGCYRIPDPLRRADQAARECARQVTSSDWQMVGTLSLKESLPKSAK